VNSPTHSLVALAILSRKGERKRNWAVFAGSLVPDLFIYGCWVWLTFVKGHSQSEIWDEIYFDDPMQLAASIFNSVPLYVGLAALGFAFRARLWGRLLGLLALAALLHIALDFPVHNHDAYAHFWPFSDWRFISPISYWEVDHHAGITSLIEAAIGIAAIAVLWRRFTARWVKGVLIILLAAYLLSQLAMRLAYLDASA